LKKNCLILLSKEGEFPARPKGKAEEDGDLAGKERKKSL